MSKLCLKCNKRRWYANPINKYEGYLGTFIKQNSYLNNKKAIGIRKNIAYSLQYLEYLQVSLNELNISTVTTTMLYKSFIVTGASIIEAIFYSVIVSNGQFPKDEWQSVKKINSSQFTHGTDMLKVDTEIFVKLQSPREIEMTFDGMCQKIEKKKLLGHSSSFYAQLKHIRRLRNRVHLHAIEGHFDTDWVNFNNKDFTLMKTILFEILTSALFDVAGRNINLFDFLKV